MKRALYVTTNCLSPSDGVSKKIRAQVKALKNIGYDTELVYSSKNGLCIEKDHRYYEKFFSKKLKYLFFLHLANFVTTNNKTYDLVYIRNPHGGLYSIFLVSFLRAISGSKTKIIEIPTYPYRAEISTIYQWLSYLVHSISKRFFIHYIDKIVYMGEPMDKIWNRPCIRISNGVDLSVIPIVSHICDVNKRNLSVFNFIAVARMESWHGYDRIIRGIADYYAYHNFSPVQQVKLHLIGDNEPCLTNLKELARELGVSSQVEFYGALYGDALDSVFSKCQIAIDALGRHRSGNNYNSSIKSKEYCGRGLPFIKSHMDDDFDDCHFVYNCSPDDENIKVDDVLRWYLNNAFESKTIRLYAENKLTWENIFSFLKYD